MFVVSLKMQKEDYEKGVQWIRDLVTGAVFSKERCALILCLGRASTLTSRLAVIVAKQLQELPYEKRQGNSIARSWINKLTYDIERSTSEACSLLSLLEFVPKTAKALEEEPEVVIQRLEEVRQYCEWHRFLGARL